MSEHLGTIASISTMRAMLDLHVFDDGILVARQSLRTTIRTMADLGAFRAASGIAAVVAGPTPDAGMPPDRDALIAADPANMFIPFAEIAELGLKKGFLGGGRLDVVRTDGSSRRFEWKKIYNDFAAVEALVRRAAGPKVTSA